MPDTDRHTPVIFLSGDVDDARLAELQAIGPDAQLRYFDNQADLEAAIEEADIVAGRVSADALARASRLKWIHSWAAGPNSQLFPAMLDSPVILTCSKGNGAVPLAEHAMMLMLMLNRNAMRWVEAQRERRWDHFVHGELVGKTCAILGTGYSGQDLAAKAKAFHMRVTGLRRGGDVPANFDAMYTRAQLDAFVAEADFLVVTAPNTPETRDLLGEAQFCAMKPDAYYICFSRGGIANDAALFRALDEKWIAGAGLDAHGVEPLPADSPFWALENVIITPHNGATTNGTKTRGYEVFRDNFRRWVAGEPLANVVNKQMGY
jgi:phosphoglycerate dehydrogenase-like enzyme